jgi:uncharacterized membrane protein YphA (DoxX/SURF4 family)
MSSEPNRADSPPTADWLTLAARGVLAATFIYMGATKAWHPEEFLRLIRQYGLQGPPLAVNFLAAALPWIEIWCGLLLAVGVAVRGTALLAGGMLVAFTAIVLMRALELQAANGLPLCAVAFDCGCGSGVVPVCRKLVENVALIGLSAWLACVRRTCWCLWYTLGVQSGEE